MGQTLPMVDLDCTCVHNQAHSNTHSGHSFPRATDGCPGTLLRKLSHCILPSIKEPVLTRALKATKGSGGQAVNVSLDNFKALSQRDAAAVGSQSFEPCNSECTFVQAFKQLHTLCPRLLRTVWEHDRSFHITFVGELGMDAGGVYREGMSRIVEDLFSPHLRLLLQCPNGQHSTGTNQDKYVPHPRKPSHLETQMYEFVGKLVGISLRANMTLPIEFPELIWKLIVGQTPIYSFQELASIDAITAHVLRSIAECEADGICDEESFAEKYGDAQLSFETDGSDGLPKALIPDGANRAVTFSSRHKFVQLALRYRLHEFDEQVASIVRGLSTIVPLRPLRLFSWHEFQALVCGEPDFDIAFLRAHTDYRGYSSRDETIDLLWRVMGSLSAEERCGFVRFAWGRSRLPPKAQWWQNMKISRHRAVTALPVAHTCFFSIELPPYTTEKEMRHGLLTAIHFGVGGILND